MKSTVLNSKTELSKLWYVLHLLTVFHHFAGSSSSPDEDRLYKHLANKPHNIMTTPIANKYETMNVSVGIGILKFVDLVSLED